MTDHLRTIANQIANGDWQSATGDKGHWRLDFVTLEERIYKALREAAAAPMQSERIDASGWTGSDRHNPYHRS